MGMIAPRLGTQKLKFGVLAEFPAGAGGRPETFRFVGRKELMVDYWEGE
jgi:hypothetical protein